jgi:hypothetical protein
MQCSNGARSSPTHCGAMATFHSKKGRRRLRAPVSLDFGLATALASGPRVVSLSAYRCAVRRWPRWLQDR